MDLLHLLDAFGKFHRGLDRAVGLLVVADLDRAFGRRIGSFRPRQVAEMGIDSNFGTARRDGRDTEDILAEPCRRTTRPTVAEAMAESDIAIGSEVAMEILFTGGDGLVDGAGIICPGKVEVLPEGGGTLIQHAAPVLTDEVEAGQGEASVIAAAAMRDYMA